MNKKKITEIEKAKIQLVIFLIFIAFVFAYSRVLVARNNNIKSEEDIIEIASDVSLDKIEKYEFYIKISVIENNVKNEYIYSGNIDNKNGTINYNDEKYLILNKEYYDKNYTKKEDMFYCIDNKYLDLDNINSYLIENNLVNNQYQEKLNIIVNKNIEEVYIYIDKKIIDDKIVLNIDYTNLVKLENSQINSYIIEYQIYDFV